METLIVGLYWFINGAIFILFARKAFKTKKRSAGWFLGLLLSVLVGILLLLGAVICFDHSF